MVRLFNWLWPKYGKAIKLHHRFVFSHIYVQAQISLLSAFHNLFNGHCTLHLIFVSPSLGSVHPFCFSFLVKNLFLNKYSLLNKIFTSFFDKQIWFVQIGKHVHLAYALLNAWTSFMSSEVIPIKCSKGLLKRIIHL